MDETSTIKPDLRKELLYSWEKGFIEDKPAEEQNHAWSTILLRKDESRNSGKALTNPLKGKLTSQTRSTVKTAAGAIYRKSCIAQSKLKSPLPLQIARNARSPKIEDAKKKRVGTNAQLQKTLDSEDEESYKSKADVIKATARFQDSPLSVTSRDTESRGTKLGCKTDEAQQRWADFEYAQTVERKQPNEENLKTDCSRGTSSKTCYSNF